MLSPSMPAPGSTILAPAAGTENARAQALAWNMGTMASSESSERKPKTSGWFAIRPCSTLERCEYRTPLGLPVVPEV